MNLHSLERVKQPTVALLNDTSLYESHFGCHLVGQTFREQFARTGLRLKYSFGRHWELKDIERFLAEVDMVVVNGEGSIHHGKRQNLLSVAGKFPSVLVNCVFQENPKNENLAKFLYCSARESKSAESIRAEGVECDVTPDALFASAMLRSFVKPKPEMAVGVTDSVRKRRIGFGPLRIKRSYGFSPIGKTAAEYLKEICKYESLCIGRFHAVVAAAVMKIPFSCWDSNTWKIKGLMEDMGVSQYHFSSHKEARGSIPEVFDKKITDFSDDAEARIYSMFDKIAELIKELESS